MISWRPRTRACAALAAFMGAFSCGTACAETMASLLEALRDRGINIIYSSALVRPDMQVPAQGAAADPLTRVRDALLANGLVLQNVGPDLYIVTQGAPVPSTPDVAAEQRESSELSEVSVYASRYSLGGENLGSSHLLDTTQIEQVPGAQDDALRATRVIPGVVSNLSTRPYIRGSSVDDLLVQFDGVPLADPFHLKNFQSLISAMDPAAVEGIEIYSGGFPVHYGTRSGGVIDVQPRALAEGYEHTVGASLVAYDASSVGHMEKWPVDWLATVRRSVPDVVIKPINGQDGEPQFMDSLGRLRWHGDDGSALTLGWLLLEDSIQLSTETNDESTKADYRDEYAWLAYETGGNTALRSRSVLAATWADRTRTGLLNETGFANGALLEEREFSSVDLHSLWTFQSSPDTLWTYSVEAAHAKSDLQYDRSGSIAPSVATAFGRSTDLSLLSTLAPDVTTYAASIAARHRWSPLEAELGLRIDAQRYSMSGLRHQLSPRLNLRYDIAPRWRLYGSWGSFTQAQRVDEWRLEERQVAPDSSALAIHTVLGVAYEHSRNTHVSVEVYRKRWTEVRPYFDNLFDTLSLVPDLQPDRVRLAPHSSEAAGIELDVRHAFSAALEARAAYAYSRVSDDFATRDDVPRSWDQPHAITLGLAWKASPWSASAVLGLHRGWPRTPSTLVPGTAAGGASLAVGARNAARWGNYFSADINAAWIHPWRESELSLWFELTNSTDRRNPCCEHLRALPGDGGELSAEPNYYLPRTLNVGVTWKLRHGR